MLELLALLLAYLAAVLQYGTTRVRGRARFSVFERRPRATLARAVALALVTTAAWVWSYAEPASAAALAVLTGLMVMASAVTLLGSLAPRVVRVSAWLAAAAVPIVTLLGNWP